MVIGVNLKLAGKIPFGRQWFRLTRVVPFQIKEISIE